MWKLEEFVFWLVLADRGRVATTLFVRSTGTESEGLTVTLISCQWSKLIVNNRIKLIEECEHTRRHVQKILLEVRFKKNPLH